MGESSVERDTSALPPRKSSPAAVSSMSSLLNNLIVTGPSASDIASNRSSLIQVPANSAEAATTTG